MILHIYDSGLFQEQNNSNPVQTSLATKREIYGLIIGLVRDAAYLKCKRVEELKECY